MDPKAPTAPNHPPGDPGAAPPPSAPPDGTTKVPTTLRAWPVAIGFLAGVALYVALSRAGVTPNMVWEQREKVVAAAAAFLLVYSRLPLQMRQKWEEHPRWWAFIAVLRAVFPSAADLPKPIATLASGIGPAPSTPSTDPTATKELAP